MARLYLKKTALGSFVPADEPSADLARKYKVGEVRRADIVLPRSYNDHCRCMALLSLTFENLPERYAGQWPTFKAFRRAVAEAAGYVEEYTSMDGEVRRSGVSLSYDAIPDNMDFMQAFADMMTICTMILDIGEPELAAEVSRYASDKYGRAA